MTTNCNEPVYELIIKYFFFLHIRRVLFSNVSLYVRNPDYATAYILISYI